MITSSTQVPVNVAFTPKPVLTFANSTCKADDSTKSAIAGQTLAKGGTIIIGGTQLALDQAGTNVIIGTSTQKLLSTSVTAVQKHIVTFDGSTYTADSASSFIINSQTLTKGGVITVQGTPISYAVAGTDVVVGTSTEAVGLGGYIMSGLGAEPSSAAPVQCTGNAARQFPTSWFWCLTLGILTVYLVG